MTASPHKVRQLVLKGFVQFFTVYEENPTNLLNHWTK